MMVSTLGGFGKGRTIFDEEGCHISPLTSETIIFHCMKNYFMRQKNYNMIPCTCQEVFAQVTDRM